MIWAGQMIHLVGSDNVYLVVCIQMSLGVGNQLYPQGTGTQLNLHCHDEEKLEENDKQFKILKQNPFIH